MLFNCFKWPEMRGVAHGLIARLHEGHTRQRFSIPVVDFVRVFAPNAAPQEVERVRLRGDIHFIANVASEGGTFSLAEGARAIFDLGRERLVMRVPEKMSGMYELLPKGFRVEFNEGEELEGCKRILLLVCNPVKSVEVTEARVDIHLRNKILDFCVEFE